MNVLRIDDHVREVVLADHFAGQLLAIVPRSGSDQGLVEDEGFGFGVGQHFAVAQR